MPPGYEERLIELQKCLDEEGNGEKIDRESMARFRNLVKYLPDDVEFTITLTPDNLIYISSVIKGSDE